jgi:hypothetical protein
MVIRGFLGFALGQSQSSISFSSLEWSVRLQALDRYAEREHPTLGARSAALPQLQLGPQAKVVCDEKWNCDAIGSLIVIL